jgi:hypothetical protein
MILFIDLKFFSQSKRGPKGKGCAGWASGWCNAEQRTRPRTTGACARCSLYYTPRPVISPAAPHGFCSVLISSWPPAPARAVPCFLPPPPSSVPRRSAPPPLLPARYLPLTFSAFRSPVWCYTSLTLTALSFQLFKCIIHRVWCYTSPEVESLECQ